MFAVPLSTHILRLKGTHIYGPSGPGKPWEGFLTLWRVFLHHICEVSAALDFQRIEALLHWPHGAVGSEGSAYLHLSSYPHHPIAWPCL